MPKIRGYQPKDERPKNKVDVLLNEIERFQDLCTHLEVHYIDEEFPLLRTKVPGTYLGADKDGVREVQLECYICNAEISLDPREKCPMCLAKMESGSKLHKYNKYLNEGHDEPGKSYGYGFGIRLHSCTNCAFSIAAMEPIKP